MDLSVIVSTYNRAADVRRLLASLDGVHVPAHHRWELILVDNNSSDDTAAIVREHAARAGYEIRYLFERRQGKSHGVNTGIAAAAGRLIAFTDDDAIVPSGWVESIIQCFASNPELHCLGGRVELHDQRDAPVTIKTSLEREAIDLQRFSTSDVQIIGCNMAFRREVLERVGKFDVNFGPGARVGVAEDLDILYRIVNAGYVLHYVPEIYVHHNHGRRTPEQLAKVDLGYLVGRGGFYCKFALRGDRQVMRWAWWELRMLAGNWLSSPFGKGVPSLRRAYRITTGMLRYLLLRQSEA